jgi:hypothetical protein
MNVVLFMLTWVLVFGLYRGPLDSGWMVGSDLFASFCAASLVISLPLLIKDLA